MKPITVWYRGNADGRFEHNHIEDGHSEELVPKALFPQQAKAWCNEHWIGEHAWLDENYKVCRT